MFLGALFDPFCDLWESDALERTIAERDGRFEVSVSRETMPPSGDGDVDLRLTTVSASAGGVRFDVCLVQLDDLRYVTGEVQAETGLAPMSVPLGDLGASWLDTELGGIFANLFDPLIGKPVNTEDAEYGLAAWKDADSGVADRADDPAGL